MIFSSIPGFKPCRLAVVDHRAAALVASLAKDPLGGDVARLVVRVRDDPKAIRVQLLLQAKRIVDDDLAREEDDLQLIPELPGLDGIIQLS